jgi:hypothetical protein
VNQRLVHVQEDRLEVTGLTGQFVLLPRLLYLYGTTEAQHLYALVEVLPVEVHQVTGLMLFEAAVQISYVVHCRLL